MKGLNDVEAVQIDLFGEQVNASVVDDRKSEAVTKLRAEMEANQTNPYVQVIGAYLVKHLNSHPEHAESFLAEDKTILKSLDAMRKEAEKKKVGNVAVLTDAEGFAVVLEYFGAKKGAKVK